MQVIGLPSHVIRNGGAAAPLLAAKTPDIEAARRRDAVHRWRGARAAGPFCGTGREGRRRSARHPLSLGEAARKAKVPGELVQIDTLFINIRPDEAI
jgi:hypothetical protein